MTDSVWANDLRARLEQRLRESTGLPIELKVDRNPMFVTSRLVAFRDRCYATALWEDEGRQAAAQARWFDWDEGADPERVIAALEELIPNLIVEGEHLVPQGQLWLGKERSVFLLLNGDLARGVRHEEVTEDGYNAWLDRQRPSTHTG